MLNQIVDKYGQRGQHKFVQSWFYQQYNLTIYANKLILTGKVHLNTYSNSAGQQTGEVHV